MLAFDIFYSDDMKYVYYTVCPRSSAPFCIVSQYIKWVTTSWTYSTQRKIFIRRTAFGGKSLFSAELKSGGFVVSLDDDCVKKSAKSFYDCVEKFTQEQNHRSF